MANNHVIDPKFFYPAIEIFSFNYDIYNRDSFTIDDYGNRIDHYTKRTIRGSIQSQGKREVQNEQGNTIEMTYKFYCKSLYRIDIHDYIEYKHKALRVDEVQDIDEYGCRECSLTEVDISAYKDLAEYLNYIQGVEII